MGKTKIGVENVVGVLAAIVDIVVGDITADGVIRNVAGASTEVVMEEGAKDVVTTSVVVTDTEVVMVTGTDADDDVNKNGVVKDATEIGTEDDETDGSVDEIPDGALDVIACIVVVTVT